MNHIILQKNSNIQVVTLGFAVHYYIFNSLYLLSTHLRREALIIIFIQILHFFLFLYILYPNTLLFCITTPLILLLYILSLLLAPFFLWNILYLITCPILCIVFFTVPYTLLEIVLLILLALANTCINIYIILYWNKLNCRKLVAQGYKPIEGDIYSQQLLQYYMKEDS